MRAFVKLTATTDAIELADVALPQIDDDEVLVLVRAIGVGIHDSYFLPTTARYPYPSGSRLQVSSTGSAAPSPPTGLVIESPS